MAFVNISVNVVAEYSGLCEEVAQEFLEQFDQINALLARHGMPATIEPDFVVDFSPADEQREYISKFPTEYIRSLQRAYATHCKVRHMRLPCKDRNAVNNPQTSMPHLAVAHVCSAHEMCLSNAMLWCRALAFRLRKKTSCQAMSTCLINWRVIFGTVTLSAMRTAKGCTYPMQQ